MAYGISKRGGLLALLPVDILGYLLDDSDLSRDGWAFRLVQRLALAWKGGQKEKELFYRVLVRLDLGALAEACEARACALGFESLRHLILKESIFPSVDESLVMEIVNAVSPRLRTFSWLWYAKSISAIPISTSLLGQLDMPNLETLEFRYTRPSPWVKIPASLFNGFPKLRVVRVVTLYQPELLREFRCAFGSIQHRVEEIAIRCLEFHRQENEIVKPYVDDSPNDVEGAPSASFPLPSVNQPNSLFP